MIPSRSVLSASLLFVLLSQSTSQAQDQQTAEQDLPEKNPAAKTPEQIDWSKQPFWGKGFVTAVVAGQDGSVWAGDEENALFRIGPGGAKRITGPPDAYCYAMALAASDGAVWVGTEVGVSQIKPDGTIRTLLQDDGLPFNQIVKMAEDAEGRIWFGGYLGGAARIDASGTIRPVPKSRLVSDELNDLCVDQTGKVWLCGRGGVTVFDPDRWLPRTWLVPKDSKLADRKEIVKILPDRRITAVCPKDADHVYLGTWRSGLWLFHIEKQQLTKVKNVKQDFIYRLAPDRSDGVLVSSYGGGLMRVGATGVSPVPMDTKTQNPPQDDPPPKIPLEKIGPVDPAVTRPAVCLFNSRLAAIEKTPRPRNGELMVAKGPQAVYLGEDWVTTGDWIGNYGEFRYILCAMMPPFDYYGGAGGSYLACSPYIGEHRKKFRLRPNESGFAIIAKSAGLELPPQEPELIEDTLRYWLHWLYTDNPKVLRLPPDDRSADKRKNRRHAEWDDHAEAYPRRWTGPHLYFDLRVSEPEVEHSGIYVLSLYFMNKDGHRRNNRFRDYRITIKPLIEPWGYRKSETKGWEERFEQAKTLAAARTHDFRGGVYQQFLIREGEYTIQIHKSGSFNTTLAAVFLDKAAGKGEVEPTFSVPRGMKKP